MTQTMLMDSKLMDVFWTHAVHTTIHIKIIVMLKTNNEKNPCELLERKTEKYK
jgi:protein tyrosine phosphatase